MKSGHKFFVFSGKPPSLPSGASAQEKKVEITLQCPDQGNQSSLGDRLVVSTWFLVALSTGDLNCQVRCLPASGIHS